MKTKTGIRRNRKTWPGLMAAAGLALFSVLPAACTAQKLKLGKEPPPVPLAAGSPALALQNAFIDVAQSVGPAVVHISVEWTENVTWPQGFGNMDNFFNFFFNGPGNGQGGAPVYKQQERALGSGILISPDGTILTNAHVIGKAHKVTVTLLDGSTYSARIIGKDKNFDIGVVKIEDGKRKFPYAVLGNSDDIRVGQWAIAIGNPFGLDHTLTTGVISAKGRSINMGGEGGGLESYIQTDASINPGNSGGPLCDIQGRVIGVNSAIYSESGGSVGIGFAIPSNIARKAAEDIVAYGKITRAGIGAVIQSLSPQLAQSFGLSTTQGALIAGVNPGSAAQKAGLKPGDIILKVNGETVADSGDLVSKLFAYNPGDRVRFTILRKGVQRVVSVRLQKLGESRAEQGENQQEESNGESSGNTDKWGLAYQDPKPGMNRRPAKGAPKGPVITQVDPGSPAAAAGVAPGDVIVRAGGVRVTSSGGLSKVLGKGSTNNGVRLFLWRDGTTLYAFLQKGDE